MKQSFHLKDVTGLWQKNNIFPYFFEIYKIAHIIFINNSLADIKCLEIRLDDSYVEEFKIKYVEEFSDDCVKIRLENENDYLEVENLVRNSFWNVYRPGAYEHFIVHNLRNDESFIRKLAFVIEKDGLIIGQINYSKGKIHGENGNVSEAIILGPVSIEENYQNMGYGTKLIEYTLDIAEKDAIPYVFVVGDENYYGRFGFESASKYNIFLEGTDTDEECPFFMIKIFDKDKTTFEKSIFTNPDVFNVDEMDVDEFDRQFEYKEKKVLDGQL